MENKYIIKFINHHKLFRIRRNFKMLEAAKEANNMYAYNNINKLIMELLGVEISFNELKKMLEN